MPVQQLNEQLAELRAQLNADEVTLEQREEIETLIARIELQRELEPGAPGASVTDGVNLAVERFEVAHPQLAGTLRNIVQTLGNIGI